MRCNRNRRGIRAANLDAPISSLAPFSWLDSTSYTIDGVSGKVGSFVDRGTGIRAFTANHILSQATSAQQVALPSNQGALNNRLCVTFAGNQWYVSNSTASTWKFMHDGTGVEIHRVFIPTNVSAVLRVHWSNRDFGATSGAWVSLQTDARATGIAYDVTGQVVYASATGALSAGVGYRFSYYYSESNPGHDYWAERTGVSALTGNSSRTPSTDNPPIVPVLGAARTTGTSCDESHWACTLIWNRVLTSAERSAVLAWIQRKYGVA